jgi:hypothetical protein
MAVDLMRSILNDIKIIILNHLKGNVESNSNHLHFRYLYNKLFKRVK